jgi:hypothetical protein
MMDSFGFVNSEQVAFRASERAFWKARHCTIILTVFHSISWVLILWWGPPVRLRVLNWTGEKRSLY